MSKVKLYDDNLQVAGMQEQDEISGVKFVGYYHDELYGDFSSAQDETISIPYNS